MNTTIKLGVAGALALGAIAAHASIAEPSSGASDAILFAEVLNSNLTGVVASYAGDTGVSINTLVAGLSGSSTTVLQGDANLAKLFNADASGDVIEWAVEGGQYLGGNSTTNFKTAGAAQFITTVFGNNTATALAGENTSNLTHWATLSQDVSAINANSGGANSVEGPSTAGAGVWDYTNGSTTAAKWYANGPESANLYDGTTAQNLYYVTGGGSTGAKVTSAIEGTATLTATGLVLSAAGGTITPPPPPPVPLPAAIWLLGSGLLGLTGVARRKLKV
jgi:hypothetical protein